MLPSASFLGGIYAFPHGNVLICLFLGKNFAHRKNWTIKEQSNKMVSSWSIPETVEQSFILPKPHRALRCRHDHHWI